MTTDIQPHHTAPSWWGMAAVCVILVGAALCVLCGPRAGFGGPACWAATALIVGGLALIAAREARHQRAAARLRARGRELEQRVHDRTAQLRASELLFHALFDAMQEGVFIHDLLYDADGALVDYRVAELNAAAEAICGLTRDAVIGQRASEIAREQLGLETLAHRELITQVVATGQPAHRDFFLPRTEQYLSLSFLPIEPGKVAVIHADITVQRRAETAVLAQYHFQRQLMETIPYPIYYKDAGGLYLGCNAAFTRLTGCAEADLRGRTVAGISPPALAALCDRKDQELFAQGRGTQTFETTLTTPDGHTQTVLFCKALLTDADGAVNGLVGVIIDLTERQRMEEALRRGEETERHFRERLRVLHEVRNALIGISGVEEVCRQAVMLGHARLGFDRLSLWFRTETPDRARGTFGIDESGHLRDERAREVSVTPSSPMGRVLSGEQRVLVVEDATLLNDHAEPIGRGTHALAGIWDGHAITGVLCTDNLCNGAPLTSTHLELLELYAETLGHLVALKRVETALRDSEHRYRTLFELSPFGILLLDPDTTQVLDYNAAVCRRLGYTPEEMTTLRLQDFEAKESASDILAHVSRIERDGEDEFLTHHRTKTGELLDVNVYSRAIALDGRRMHYSIFQDVTAQRRTDLALREAHQALRTLVDASPLAILSLDLAGNITSWNPAAVAMFGWTELEVRGRDNPTVPAEWREQFASARARAAGGAIVSIPEAPGVRKDGTRIPVSLAIAPTRDAGGAVTGCVALLADISAQQQAAEQLRTHQEALRALAAEVMRTEEHERRRLAQEMHDSVSQALALTKMRLGGLRAALAAPELAGEYTAIIGLLDQTIQHTRSLTFALSPPILYELGLAAALEWLAEDLQRQSDLTITVEQETRAQVKDIDLRAFLFMATREVLINVIKHAGARHATVLLRRVEGRLHITVADDGVGFDAAHLTRPPTREGGFGLFSLRERLQHLDGQLQIVSAPGQGTRVTLVAPPATRQTAAPAPPEKGFIDVDSHSAR